VFDGDHGAAQVEVEHLNHVLELRFVDSERNEVTVVRGRENGSQVCEGEVTRLAELDCHRAILPESSSDKARR
jgi:hypothetical protein